MKGTQIYKSLIKAGVCAPGDVDERSICAPADEAFIESYLEARGR